MESSPSSGFTCPSYPEVPTNNCFFLVYLLGHYYFFMITDIVLYSLF